MPLVRSSVMEWLWWALLLFVVLGWPVVFVALRVARRRVTGRDELDV
jgi:hypothetical protein